MSHTTWEPLRLNREWDVRWSEKQQDEAVHRADDQVYQAKAHLEATIRCVQSATESYSDALRWSAQARAFRDTHRPDTEQER